MVWTVLCLALTLPLQLQPDRGEARLVWRDALPALAESACVLWDVDGGGLPDVALGQPVWRCLGGRGRVVVLSSESGAVLQVLTPDSRRLGFGGALAVQPRGPARLAVAFQAGALDEARLGVVVYGPAADGSGLLEQRRVSAAGGLRTARPWRWRTPELVGLGDLDGDGLGDWLLGLPSHPVPGARWSSGRVLALGGDGGLLWDLVAGEGEAALGAALAVVPDLDDDGCVDVVVGSPGTGSADVTLGSVHLLSGRSGLELERHLASRCGQALGAGLVAGELGALVVGGGGSGCAPGVWSWRPGHEPRAALTFAADDPPDSLRVERAGGALLVAGPDAGRESVWVLAPDALDDGRSLDLSARGAGDLARIAPLADDGDGVGPLTAVRHGDSLRVVVTRRASDGSTVVAAWDLPHPRPGAAEPSRGGPGLESSLAGR